MGGGTIGAACKVTVVGTKTKFRIIVNASRTPAPATVTHIRKSPVLAPNAVCPPVRENR
jgi:hypothetical protein